MRLLLPALLAILPTSTFAFYPYQRGDNEKASQNSPRAVSRPRTAISDNSFHVPIRRANNFPIVQAADPAGEHSLGVHQDGSDHSYFCAFKVGTSEKEFHLLLDSAASNTWLMSGDCTTNACNLHTTLGARDSASLRSHSGTFSVTYGTGSVSGGEGTDTVRFGDVSVPLIFGLAQNVSEEFASFPMDGILGLGRQENIADTNGMIAAPALMDVLISEKVITTKLYALDLWRASDGGTNTGALHFGQADTRRYSGDLNQIPAIKNSLGFWEVAVKDAGVNGNIAGLGGRTAIIDSGTSYVLMPHDDAVQLHELISGYKTDGVEGFTVPCDSTAKVQLTFGSITYDIQPADYVGGQTANGQCATNIIGRQTFGARQWLVGDVFLKNVYTVFDFEGARIGFGVKRKVEAGDGSGPSPSGESNDADVTYVSPAIQHPFPTTTLTPYVTTTVVTTSVTSTQRSTISSVTSADEPVKPTEMPLSTTEATADLHAQEPSPATAKPESPPAEASDTAQAPLPSSADTMSITTTLLTSSLAVSDTTRAPTATAPTLLPLGVSATAAATGAASGTASGSAASSTPSSTTNSGARVGMSWVLVVTFGMYVMYSLLG